MKKPKAIETVYKGYRFRSRIEARWAVFFDALGVPWEYEVEGFDLGNNVRYLPDFYLPQLNAWIEIKGEKATEEEMEKCLLLMKSFETESGSSDLVILGGSIGRDVMNEFKSFAKSLGKSSDECATELLEHLTSMPKVFLFEGGFSRLNCLWFTDKFSVEMQSLDVLFCVLAKRSTSNFLSAIKAARSARFEHGETPKANP